MAATRIEDIVNYHTFDNKYLIFVVRHPLPSPRFGPQTGDLTLPPLEHCSMQLTSRPAATTNRCPRNHFSTDGNMKFRWLSSAVGRQCRGQSSLTHQHEQNGFSSASLTELSVIGLQLHRWVEEATKTQAQEQTPPHLTTMTTSTTSPLLPVNHPHHRSTQTSRCTRLPSRSSSLLFFLMFPGGLGLDALFEDHGVCFASF